MSVHKLNKLALLGGAVAVGGLVWFFGLYRPLEIKRAKIEAQIRNLMQKLQGATVSEKDLKSLEARRDQLRLEVADIEKRVWPKTLLPRIAEKIEERGRSYGLRFISITPSYEDLLRLGEVEADGKKSPLIKLPVQFEMEGDYKSFGRFVDQVAQFPFVFTVGDFRLSRDPESYPRLKISMKGYLFLREVE